MARPAIVGLALAPNSVQAIILALANPIRREVLVTLHRGEKAVSQLADELDLDVTRVSHHLHDLTATGLLVFRREKRQHFYQLAPVVRIDQSDDGLRVTIGASNDEAVILWLRL